MTEVLHPRLAERLIGHRAAEASFLDAFNAGRLHHAWLLAGPEGVGKATFAYRAAKFLICHGKEEADAGGLFGDPEPKRFGTMDAPAAGMDIQLLAAQSHPNLMVIEREWDEKKKAYKKEIGVDVVRKLQGFFGLTAADGGWRVAIVDTADDLNRQSANALLKILEEPPKKSILFLLTAAPGRLLPTIRSRCRTVKFEPLRDGEVVDILASHDPAIDPGVAGALARLSEGAPGKALTYAARDGLKTYESVRNIFSRINRMPLTDIHTLADTMGAKAAADVYDDFFEMTRLWLARIVRAKATGQHVPDILPGDAQVVADLAGRTDLEQLMALWEKTAEIKRRADGLNLEKRQTVFSLLLDLKSAA